MKNNLFKRNLYVIVEGLTELIFLGHLNSLFDSNYNLIFINAKDATRIIREYKRIKKINPDADVLVIYDLDGRKTVNNIMKEYKDNDIDIKRNQIFFINPTFELIFVLCKCRKTPIKSTDYNLYIKKYYGINDYRKTETQLRRMVKCISKEDISYLLDNIDRLLDNDSTSIRSSNLDKLLVDIFMIDIKMKTYQ